MVTGILWCAADWYVCISRSGWVCLRVYLLLFVWATVCSLRCFAWVVCEVLPFCFVGLFWVLGWSCDDVGF